MSTNKKINDIRETVGETEGYTNKTVKFDKHRKIKMWGFLIGLVVLIIISAVIFTTPKKADFNFEDGVKQTERYQIDKKTNILIDAPKDPTRSYFEFGGWYLDKECTIGGLYNNDKDNSLCEYEFKSSKKILLYAKWNPIQYKVTYVVDDGLELNSDQKETMTNNNIASYTIKHTAQEYEVREFVEKLRAENPEKYVNSVNAQKNIADAVDKFKSDCNLGDRTLVAPTIRGYEFIGWFIDNDPNQPIAKLNQLEPVEITIYAMWRQII